MSTEAGKASISRNTKETQIDLSINLFGTGKNEIDTGIGFLDHMLTLFSKHGLIDLSIKCVGDINVDYHHTVEDIGLALGTAIDQALGERRGIRRYGFFLLPMDEFFAELTRFRKKNKNATKEQKEAFAARWDWHRMTEQDTNFWAKVFKFIDE